MSTIQIKVIDAVSRAPVSGAQVAVYLRSGGKGEKTRLLLGRSSRDGSAAFDVRFDSAEVAEVLPIVRAPGRREWRSPALPAAMRPETQPFEPPRVSAKDRVPIEVMLERGVTLGGVVRDEEGSPIAGAAIGLVLSAPMGCSWPYAFRFSDTDDWPPPCTTDEAGRYEWLSFPEERAGAGRWVLTAEHQDFVPGMVQAVESLPPDPHGVIHADFTLGKGNHLRGRVLGPGGLPLPAATVTLRAEPTPDQPICVRFERKARSDEEGRFSIQGLQALGHDLDVEASGCAPYREKLDLSRPPTEREVRLATGTDLEGRVLDGEGVPMAGLTIFALLREARVFRRANTDDHGRFRIPGLPEQGQVELRASGHFERTIALPSEPLTIVLGKRLDLEAKLVSAEDGEPLGPPGAITLLGPGFSRWVEIESAGCIRCLDLPAGRYRLLPQLPGRASIVSEFELPEGGLGQPLVIRLPRGGRVTGMVTDDGGAPLAGVTVAALGEFGLPEREAQTDASGVYDLDGLNQRAYLIFTLEGFALRAIPLKETGSHEAPARIEVVMRPGATVRGKVTSRDGAPQARVFLKVRPEGVEHSPLPLPTALTDDSGAYVLSHVPEGAMVIAAGPVEQRLEVRHGQHIDLDFVL